MNWQTIILVALVALLNVVATAKVFRSELLVPRQRMLQILLIWVIPVVGAVICLVFAASDRPTQDLTRDPAFHPAKANWDVVPISQSAADGD